MSTIPRTRTQPIERNENVELMLLLLMLFGVDQQVLHAFFPTRSDQLVMFECCFGKRSLRLFHNELQQAIAVVRGASCLFQSTNAIHLTHLFDFFLLLFHSFNNEFQSARETNINYFFACKVVYLNMKYFINHRREKFNLVLSSHGHTKLYTSREHERERERKDDIIQ